MLLTAWFWLDLPDLYTRNHVQFCIKAGTPIDTTTTKLIFLALMVKRVTTPPPLYSTSNLNKKHFSNPSNPPAAHWLDILLIPPYILVFQFLSFKWIVYHCLIDFVFLMFFKPHTLIGFSRLYHPYIRRYKAVFLKWAIHTKCLPEFVMSNLLLLFTLANCWWSYFNYWQQKTVQKLGLAFSSWEFSSVALGPHHHILLHTGNSVSLRIAHVYNAVTRYGFSKD